MRSVWLFFIMCGVFTVASGLTDIARELTRIGPTVSCAMMKH